MRPLNKLGLMIKPTHQCNLNCKYCYDKPFKDTIKETMTLDMVDEISRKADHVAKNVNWIWHGGEPLLMGRKWLLQANKIIKNNIVNPRITLQTNGVLLSEKMRMALTNDGVGIGLSYDYGKTTRGESDIVYENIKKLKTQTSRAGVITVINDKNVNSLEEMYEKIKKAGHSASFNPVTAIEFGEDPVNVDNYLDKYFDFFLYWLYDTEGILERSFISLIRGLMGSSKVPCVYNKCVNSWLSINPLGDIYPCDRFYPERYGAGNIKDYVSLVDAFYSEGYTRFREEIVEKRMKCIENCEFYEICGGGCHSVDITRYGSASHFDIESLHCRFTRGILKLAFEHLKDLSEKDKLKLNPAVVKVLHENGYRSLSFIKENVKEIIRSKQEENKQL